MTLAYLEIYCAKAVKGRKNYVIYLDTRVSWSFFLIFFYGMHLLLYKSTRKMIGKTGAPKTNTYALLFKRAVPS